jgi:hypothetical protein
MNGTKSKKGKYGWRSMVVNHKEKTKTVGASCRLKSESRIRAKACEQRARKLPFGGE